MFDILIMLKCYIQQTIVENNTYFEQNIQTKTTIQKRNWFCCMGVQGSQIYTFIFCM